MQYYTWRWFVHEVDLQLVLALLAEERLVLVQLLLLVILSSQVRLQWESMMEVLGANTMFMRRLT